MLLCLTVLGSLTACSDDDDPQEPPTKEALANTEWSGSGYGVTANFRLASDGTVMLEVRDAESGSLLESGEGQYTYNEESGYIQANVNGWEVTGTISGTTCSMTVQGWDSEPMHFKFKRTQTGSSSDDDSPSGGGEPVLAHPSAQKFMDMLWKAPFYDWDIRFTAVSGTSIKLYINDAQTGKLLNEYTGTYQYDEQNGRLSFEAGMWQAEGKVYHNTCELTIMQNDDPDPLFLTFESYDDEVRVPATVQ